MVIAGPGTGKTQLLSMRAAHILQHTDTHARNILCLTFTNKAAANMRNRLQQLIGPDSLQINVKTFHSFAAEIMGEYPDHFWNGARLTTAPEAVQTDIIDTILGRLPLDNPLAIKFAGAYTSAKPVRDALKLAKEAGLTPEKLRAIIEVNLAYIDTIEPELVSILDKPLSYKRLEDIRQQIMELPTQDIDDSVAPLLSLSTVIQQSLADAIANDEGTNKTKHTGEWKKRFVQNENKIKGMHKQRRANQWWLHLSEVYALYRDELHARGCYDYADMLVEVITQAEQHPELLSDLQERYQYIMIDEFQDSNAAQMRLAHLISSHPATEGKPNLMVVGDDDQSIYKFNGAELENMLGFKRLYPSAEIIVLEENFRSSQAVLDASRQVIELAENRLVDHQENITKELVAKNEPKTAGSIQHISYESAEQQYYEIAERIRKQFKAGDGTIAVLARNHETLRTIAAELHRHGIPIRYEQQRNILEHEAVEQIILVLETVQAIIDGDETTTDHNLAYLLGHPVWRVPPRTLWTLAVSNRFTGKWLDSLLDHEEKTLQDFGNWLIELSTAARREKLPVLLDFILGLRESSVYKNPFRDFYITLRDNDSAYIEALSAILQLRDTVQEFTLSGSPTLADFVRFIRLHRTNNLSISDESVFVTSQQAVELLTVHKAKGLEFDSVYIVDCMEKQWQPYNRGRNVPANLPLQPYGDDMDDYIRLMYVAFTRAKHSIIASSYRYNGAGEEVVATPLIAALPKTIVEQSSQTPIRSVLETNVRWPELPHPDMSAVLAPILESYSLNVTGLINFLDLTRGGPPTFLERNLLRLPEARTVSLALGTAIHSALEYAQRRINSGDFEIDNVIDKFEREFNKEPLPLDEINRWLPNGRVILRRLFDEQLLILPEGALPEQRLQGIDIGEAIIDGKLDHVIIEDTDILISDYKTGKPLASLESQAKNLQEKIWQHKTQLTFYALLAKHYPPYAGKQATGQMLYLEAEDARSISKTYTPSQEEIERLAALSRVVYRKITKLDLPDVSGYPPSIEGVRQFEEDLLNGTI